MVPGRARRRARLRGVRQQVALPAPSRRGGPLRLALPCPQSLSLPPKCCGPGVCLLCFLWGVGDRRAVSVLRALGASGTGLQGPKVGWSIRFPVRRPFLFPNGDTRGPMCREARGVSAALPSARSRTVAVAQGSGRKGGPRGILRATITNGCFAPRLQPIECTRAHPRPPQRAVRSIADPAPGRQERERRDGLLRRGVLRAVQSAPQPVRHRGAGRAGDDPRLLGPRERVRRDPAAGQRLLRGSPDQARFGLPACRVVAQGRARLASPPGVRSRAPGEGWARGLGWVAGQHEFGCRFLSRVHLIKSTHPP